MPILNGFEATVKIRKFETDSIDPAGKSRRLSYELNGRIPIFAVSASLRESQREDMLNLGMDGWILKPIDFKRLRGILSGITDSTQRSQDVYNPGCSWEKGGWLHQAHVELVSSSEAEVSDFTTID
jgi:CheY-like chemotaxis protein